ncbi:UDP-N-acetylmuramoyl-L-alanine--D-glutamate ligase [bacterium]|nr:UDP-N-acetylmuramoyl-L-alanine--D-glutamate ligase [bacterium]
MRVEGTRWLVIGLARSGCAAGGLLRRHGARVVGVDDADLSGIEARWAQSGARSAAAAAFDEVIAGADWPERVARPDGIVISPGVPSGHPALGRWPATPLLGEIELASRFHRGRAIAITGTNGKTTTTELTAHLLRTAGIEALALGNVGRPFADRVDELGPESVAVLEVSSFQLETIDGFSPEAGAVLNLAPDHLDRYADLDAYYAAKRRLATCLQPGGLFVTWTGCAPALAWPVGRRLLFGDVAAGAEVHVADGVLCRTLADGLEPILPVGEMPLQGAPNLLNACAAVALVSPWRLSADVLAAGMRAFAGLPHRQEVVARRGGLVFVNDSKATNVHAVCAGLAGYEREVYLILGGSGKAEDFAPLRRAMGPVARAVLIGDEAERIAAALAGAVPIARAASLPEAVRAAVAAAGERGTILLSPACASFDMFRDYNERGEAFRAEALRLAAGDGVRG